MKFSFEDVTLFDWEYLYSFEIENSVGLSAFRLLNKNQEESLQQTINEFNKELNEALDKIDEEEKSNYYLQIFHLDELSIKELKRQQRYSMCLSLYSFFEGRLQSICKRIQNDFNFKIDSSDLNGNDHLLRYYNYLSKVFEMDVNSLEPQFTTIQQAKQIRNLIAHYNGYIPVKEKDKLVNLKGISYTKIEENCFQIDIDEKQFIEHVLEKMRKFLSNMLISVNNRYKILKS